MRTPQLGEPGGELILDASEYTVDVDNTSMRYAAAESGIIVEIIEALTVIQSTNEALRTNPTQD